MKKFLFLCLLLPAGIAGAQSQAVDAGAAINANLRKLGSGYRLMTVGDSAYVAGQRNGTIFGGGGLSQTLANSLYKPIGYVPTWLEITGKPTLFSGSYLDLTNKPTILAPFSGSYLDLTNRPTLFSGSYSDLTGKPTLPGSYFSGAYVDLTGKPTLFSGSYLDLTNRPTLFSGSYTDLTSKPTLFSGAYTDLTGKPTTFTPSAHTHLSTDITQDVTHRFVSDAQIAGWNSSTGSGFSGNYTDLINKPTLFSGTYSDLTGKPTLFSGSYTDLSNKPAIPSTAAEVGAVPLSTYTANRTTDQSATTSAQNTANSAISIANSGTSVNASQTMSIAALQTDKLDVATYNANTPGYQTGVQVNTTIASTTATQNTRDNGQDTQIAGRLPNSFSATQATTDAGQNTAIGLKQDAVSGKGLSTNDYTTADKSKLAAISGTNTGDQTLSLSGSNLSLSGGNTVTLPSGGSGTSFTPSTGLALTSGVLSNTLPGATQVIDVAAKYGIVADGSTDNATVLMQMRSDLAGPNKPHYQLIFPTGEVRYSNNKWLFGINNFDVYGNNTTFRTIYTGSDEALQRPFYVGSFFQDNALTYVGAVNYTTPNLVNTVSAGSITITLTTASEASNYAVGNRIFLYGYDQVGFGFPPGDRYFEWHEIASISSGVITLKRPLINSYNSAWRDVPGITGTGSAGGSGKPRIINLDRANYVYCRHAGFHDIVFGNNTGGGSGSVVFTAEDLYMERCKGEGFFWPSENRYATYEKMDVKEVEFDKLCDVVTCNNVSFSGSPNGGGSINTIRLNNCQAGESARFNSRYIDVRNSTLRGNNQPDAYTSSLHQYPGTSPVRRLTIENLTFSSTPANLADTYINFSPFNQFTIAAVSGSSIVIPVVNGQTDQEVKDKVEAGITRMLRSDGTKGGLITSVTKDDSYNSGQGAYVIAGNWGQDIVKTGTVTTTSGSPTVTGSGTAFTSEFQVGRAVISGTNYLGRIVSINSNTSITLSANAASVVTGGSISQNNAPRVGETWKWSYVKEIIDLGGHRVVDGKPLWDGGSARWAGNRNTGTVKEMRLTKRDIKLNNSEYTIPINGYVDDAECVVTKPYTGTSTSARLTLFRYDASGNQQEFFGVNTLIPGRRKVDEFNKYPATSITNDVADPTKIAGFITNLTIVYWTTGYGAISDLSVDALPDFEIIVHWREF